LRKIILILRERTFGDRSSHCKERNAKKSILFRQASSGHLMEARIDIRLALFALAQLFGGKVACAEEFAAAPSDVADADHGSMAVEGDAEHFGDGERAYFDADAAGGHVEDEALKPRRVGRGMMKPGCR
jgi:hypothetical protein